MKSEKWRRRASRCSEISILMRLAMKRAIIEEKSFDFAIRIVKLYKYLCNNKKEYVLSKQVLRSGTSIGANVAEAQQAQSKEDFISKLSIALKETTETKYWLRLLNATNYLNQSEIKSNYKYKYFHC